MHELSGHTVRIKRHLQKLPTHSGTAYGWRLSDDFPPPPQRQTVECLTVGRVLSWSRDDYVAVWLPVQAYVRPEAYVVYVHTDDLAVLR